MLTSMPLGRPSKTGIAPLRRQPRSLKQEYQEFILHRLEEYKNTLPRAELLQIGDEAVRELQGSAQDQYLLTEVLLLEHVDRIIARRLRLPSFPRWRQKHRALREAQREPTHWGFDRQHPIVPWAARVEPGDVVVVLGAAALSEALYLAAHDAEVFLLDQDLGAVEAAEGRAVTEQLGGGAFQALVINFGSWFPDLAPSLVAIAPSCLSPLRAKHRASLIADLQVRTPSGGVHVVLPAAAEHREVIPLAPEALQGLYRGWQVHAGRKSKRSGFVAIKPPRQVDTVQSALNVSE
ncbi:MAG TPA: hypothetical protein VFO67_02825 [Gemmatimonadales bacterium]|nr:hypothetical protein [Gemmatimonadales bacterium]